MAQVKKATAAAQAVSISLMDRKSVSVTLIGESGLYQNSMGAKAKRTLLLGGGKKTAAEKKTQVKHDPRAEFRDSLYRTGPGADDLAVVGFPASGFKAAMASTAILVPGINKTDVQKLLYVEGDVLPVFGDPYLRMDIVRSADIKKTPDVRTRGFLPEWCIDLTINYVSPNFDRHAVLNLLANAGQVCGIGDFRQEKGRGSFGRFRLATAEDAGLIEQLKADYGRSAQLAAIENPRCWDDETSSLLEVFDDAMSRRDVVE